MKILRLTTLLDFGGQEKQYISFTDCPELLKYQYVFAAIGFGGNAEENLRKRGLEVHILNQPFAIRNISNSWKVYQLIKKVKLDIVHTAAADRASIGNKGFEDVSNRFTVEKYIENLETLYSIKP